VVSLTTPDTVDREQIRARVRNMSDDELRKQGEAAAFLCRPDPHRKPREVFVVQLEELRAEWRRRFPKED
jgi:hypothetical protein